MSRHNPYDLRSLLLRESGVAAFSRKPQASEFAKANGWSPSNVVWAANRFSIFHIVAQQIGTDTLRILKKDGTWLDVPCKRFNPEDTRS